MKNTPTLSPCSTIAQAHTTLLKTNPASPEVRINGPLSSTVIHPFFGITTGKNARLENFAGNALQNELMKENWAILTATCENEGRFDSEYNLAADRSLKTDLSRLKLTHIPVTGMYRGINQGIGYLVTKIRNIDALDLAESYRQESILTNLGLEMTDGTQILTNTAKPVVGHAARMSEYFSILPDNTAFSLGLN
jgi:hypothetical protein